MNKPHEVKEIKIHFPYRLRCILTYLIWRGPVILCFMEFWKDEGSILFWFKEGGYFIPAGNGTIAKHLKEATMCNIKA